MLLLLLPCSQLKDLFARPEAQALSSQLEQMAAAPTPKMQRLEQELLTHFNGGALRCQLNRCVQGLVFLEGTLPSSRSGTEGGCAGFFHVLCVLWAGWQGPSPRWLHGW